MKESSAAAKLNSPLERGELQPESVSRSIIVVEETPIVEETPKYIREFFEIGAFDFKLDVLGDTWHKQASVFLVRAAPILFLAFLGAFSFFGINLVAWLLKDMQVQPRISLGVAIFGFLSCLGLGLTASIVWTKLALKSRDK